MEDILPTDLLYYQHCNVDRRVTGMSLTTFICINLHCMTITDAATDTAEYHK